MYAGVWIVGEDEHDFHLLRGMSTSATTNGASGQFLLASLSGEKLSTVMTSLSTQLTRTLSRVSTVTNHSGRSKSRERERRSVQKERLENGCSFDSTIKKISTSIINAPTEWEFYTGKDLKRLQWIPRRKTPETQFDRIPFVGGPFVCGLAIRKSIFGEGAERMVHFAQV